MKILIALIAGFVAFTGWLRVVGNPHVVETVIGLVIAVAVFLVVLFKI